MNSDFIKGFIDGFKDPSTKMPWIFIAGIVALINLIAALFFG